MNPARNEVEIIPGLVARATFEAIVKIEHVAGGKGAMELLGDASRGRMSVTLATEILKIGAAATGASVSKDSKIFAEPIVEKIGFGGILIKATELLTAAISTGEPEVSSTDP